MNRITKEEKNNILKNAVTSFVHGIEHLVKYKNSEKNIKFSIIHTFNAAELILKAYLGTINKALLWEKIDEESKKTASISTLLKRIKQFSEVQFNEKLKNDIENLRIKRNEIEHKIFILENERENVKLLIDVICGLRLFCHKYVQSDLKENLSKETISELEDVRMEFDTSFKKVINSVEEKSGKSYIIEECPDCLNNTLLYKKAKSRIKCFYCSMEYFVQKCIVCGEWFVEKENEGGSLFLGAKCKRCNDVIIDEMVEFQSGPEWEDKIIEEDAEYDKKIKEYPIEDYKN